MSTAVAALTLALASATNSDAVAVLSAATPAVILQWREVPSPSCIAFRETDSCSGSGPRIPTGDRSCDDVVPCQPGLCPSGYCECAGGVHLHPVDCHPGSHVPFSCADVCASATSNTTNATRPMLEVNNGYLSALVDVNQPGIDAVFADFHGAVDTSNLTAATSVLAQDGRWQLAVVASNATSASSPPAAQLEIVQNTTEVVHIRLHGVLDDATSPSVNETWDIALAAGSRGLVLNTSGTEVGAGLAGGAVAVHTAGFEALSIYALFDSGVVQMKNAADGADFFVGTQPLHSFYALGGGSAVDVRRSVTGSAATQVALVSNAGGSGFHTVLAGAYGGDHDVWTAAPQGTSAMTSADAAPSVWSTSTTLGANNYNFPSLELTSDPNLPFEDLEVCLVACPHFSVQRVSTTRSCS